MNMKPMETEFFELTAADRWEEEKIQGICFTEQGISLEEITYQITGEMLPGLAITPVSLDISSCGPLFILEKESVFTYDITQEHLSKIESISCRSGKSIAVNNLDIYLVQSKVKGRAREITCIARANFQTRWRKEINKNRDIRIATPGENILYILDIKNKTVSIQDRQRNEENIDLKNADGTPFTLTKPVDIAADEESSIYILEAEKKQIHKFNQQGIYCETTVLSLDELSLPAPTCFTLDKTGKFIIAYAKEKKVLQIEQKTKFKSSGIGISKPLDSKIRNCQWRRITVKSETPGNTTVSLSYYASDLPEPPGKDHPGWSAPVENPQGAFILDIKGQYLWIKVQMQSKNNSQTSPLIKRIRIFAPGPSYLEYLPALYQENERSKDFLERFLSIFQIMLEDIEAENDDVPRLLDAAQTPDEFLAWLSTWLGAVYDETWGPDRWRKFLSRAIELYKKRGTKSGLEEILELYTGCKPTIIETFHVNRELKDEEAGNLESKDNHHLFAPPAAAKLGLVPLSDILYGKSKTRFSVLFPGEVLKDNTVNINTIKRIIENWKPAHTYQGLTVFQPWFYLDMHTYLGINTVLTKPQFILEVSSVISRDTVLYDDHQPGFTIKNQKEV
jgi:phage tail-like protein